MTFYQVYFTDLEFAPSLWATFTSKALAKKQLDYIIKDYVPYNYNPEKIETMNATQNSITLRLTFSTGREKYVNAYINSIETHSSILTL